MTDNMKDIRTEAESTPQKPSAPLPRIAITQGDTNGVGYELILKVLSDPAMLEICTPVVYGHAKAAIFHRRAIKLPQTVTFHSVPSAAEAQDGRVNFVNCSDEEIPVVFGQPSKEAGAAALAALEHASEDVGRGLAAALVTAPVNKANMHGAGFAFTGHTEYLQAKFGKNGEGVLMILFNRLMRVALATTHLPLAEVSCAITQQTVEEKARLLTESLKRDFCLSAPRVAVLGLNAHAGDNGLIGTEEQDTITPAVQALSGGGLTCYGPYPADGFFGAGLYRRFDGVLAMYHDQGLAPFKALDCEGGVNFTAGLSIVRTSPDHGTAFDIAGKGIASPDSFRNAIYAAIDISRNRAAYDKAHANPLPKLYHDRKEDERGPRQPRPQFNSKATEQA